MEGEEELTLSEYMDTLASRGGVPRETWRDAQTVRYGDLYCPACGERGYRVGDGCFRCGSDEEKIQRLEPGPWNEIQ